MRSFLLLSFIGFSLLFSSCAKDKTPIHDSINKIMPLGASRVAGERPVHESYRYDLWKLLVDGGWDFDFLGTISDNAPYAEYAGISFDNNHEGRGGWTSTEIVENLNDWVEEAGTPDIVLFSSPGINDAIQGKPYADIIANINFIIDYFQTRNPNVTFVIELMAPARSDAMTTHLTAAMNDLIVDIPIIAEAQTNSTSAVIVVDMYTGFNDSLFADGLHYNNAGAEFVANRYYEVLNNILKEVE